MLVHQGSVHPIDRPRALVLASPPIGESICEILEAHGIKCINPASPSASGDFAWLCSVLFAPSHDSSKDGADCRLFAWSGFDLVILQDLWEMPRAKGFARLEFAGRVFASWDNDRGNFATKKIVLVTDPELFEWRTLQDWERQASGAIRQANGAIRQEVQRLFDPRGSLEFVSLCCERGSVAGALVRAVLGDSVDSNRLSARRNTEDISPETSAELNDSIRRGITTPVIEAAAPAIRNTIPSGTKIFLIEDEETGLKVAYRSLTGEEFVASPAANPPAWVHVVPVPSTPDPGGKRRIARKFDELLEQCNQALTEAMAQSNGTGDVVVITDILFENAITSKTGIDLISELRLHHSDRIRIIAFTGFRTPFIAMSAYHQGADFVVEKGGFGGRHDTLQLSGTDRLLQALALLCFQRGYLRQIRSRGRAARKAIENSTASDSGMVSEIIREFQRTMPRKTVSPHLQQECEDTLYYLKLIQVLGLPADRELNEELTSLTCKYDHV